MNNLHDDFLIEKLKDLGFYENTDTIKPYHAYENCTVVYDEMHNSLSVKNAKFEKSFSLKSDAEKEILQDYTSNMAINTLFTTFLIIMFPIFILGCFWLRDLVSVSGFSGIIILTYLFAAGCSLVVLIQLVPILVSLLKLEKAYQYGQLWKFVLVAFVFLAAALVIVFQI